MYVNQNNTKKVYKWITGWLYSPLRRCRLCYQSVAAGHHICRHCLTRLNPVEGHLCRCSLPCGAADNGKLCGRCINRPPAFSTAHCAWYYQFPLDRLINRYKHHGDLSIEPLLEEIWLAGITFEPPVEAILVPIPLHWRRFSRRGFNQSARLARSLSRRLELPVIKALKQPKPAPLLQGLSAKQRHQHSRGRFHVNADVNQKHLVLIDDVMTTGATANEAATVLLAAGARQVDIWTLCRVPPNTWAPFHNH